MPPHSFAPASRWLLVVTLILPAACATHQTTQSSATGRERIEVAFAPDAGAEALVIKVIEEATRSLRLAGYSFTSPAVVRALLDAKKRGIDIKVLIDDKGNHGASSVAAINLVVGAGIPTKTISAYAIHHDKYIVADGRNTETGSFNYTQSAARRNSENVPGGVGRSGDRGEVPGALERTLGAGCGRLTELLMAMRRATQHDENSSPPRVYPVAWDDQLWPTST